MSSIKNPENEAETPAPMPRTQVQGGIPRNRDPAGQQGATGSDKKAKMTPQPSAPAGLEQDSLGDAIPFEERTEEDQKKAPGQQRLGS